LKKLETYHSIVCTTYFDTLNRLGENHQCNRHTNGQTDKTAIATALRLMTPARMQLNTDNKLEINAQGRICRHC